MAKLNKKDDKIEFATKSYSERLSDEKRDKVDIAKALNEQWGKLQTLATDVYKKFIPKARQMIGQNIVVIIYSVVGLFLLVLFINYIRGDSESVQEVLSEEISVPLFSRTEDYDQAVLTPEEQADEEDVDVVFDPDLGVASYVIEWNGLPLVVSQQPTPRDLVDGDITLKDVASSIFDKNSIDQLVTEKGVAYLINSTSDQTVIMTYNGLLIFINSEVTRTADTWTKFINELN